MIEVIRRKLIELARAEQTWSYSQLNDQLDLKLNFKNKYDRGLVGDLLEEISVHEFEKDRPLLSSLIIHKGQDKEQGDGYYKMCEKLFGKPWRELKEDKIFENKKMNECFSFWKVDENYKTYKDDF